MKLHFIDQHFITLDLLENSTSIIKKFDRGKVSKFKEYFLLFFKVSLDLCFFFFEILLIVLFRYYYQIKKISCNLVTFKKMTYIPRIFYNLF